MLAKKHPAPLAGGDRAGTNAFVQRALVNLPNPKPQDICSQRLNGTPYKRVIPSAAEPKAHYRDGRDRSAPWAERYWRQQNIPRILATTLLGGSQVSFLAKILRKRGGLTRKEERLYQDILDEARRAGAFPIPPGGSR